MRKLEKKKNQWIESAHFICLPTCTHILPKDNHSKGNKTKPLLQTGPKSIPPKRPK